LTSPAELFARSGHFLLADAPAGCDAWLLARLLGGGEVGALLHIARDDARLARTAEVVRFFAPEVELIALPAWDCLPYDRVSPRPDVESARLVALARLAAIAEAPAATPYLVLSTVNAVLQRVPPRSLLAHATRRLAVGESCPPEALAEFLANNGYHRAGTVVEAGEFAIRGGILDIFPAGAAAPVRLDFFGDTIEAMRGFDPVSQRSQDRVSALDLVPVGEVFLDAASLERFRRGYRELFGAVIDDDPLFEAIDAGRSYPGMEHWLPLFHDHLETIFDYLPGMAINLDSLVEEARDSRLETIADHYEARRTAPPAQAVEGASYKPVPPERLYLDRAEWERALEDRAVGQFTGFSAPDDERRPVCDAGGRPARDFAPERNEQDERLYDAVRDYLDEARAAGKRVVIAGYSTGTLDRLAKLLGENGVAGLAAVESWREAQALGRDAVALTVLGLENGFETADLLLLGEQDILGDRLTRAPGKRRRAENFLADAGELAEGDIVVHVDHGIGRYEGLEILDVAGARHDCLRLVYDGNDKLFLPVENIEVISRYGPPESLVALDKLGGVAWQARKSRLKKRIRDMAEQLIAVAAARELHPAPVLTPPPSLYDRFCAHFAYVETEDQARAIDDTLADLAAGRPMDRLVCGDVGFGKTEVALRAAFVTAMAGKQVAIVVPTTLLCRQHLQSFTERFAGLPVRIEQLSRLVTGKAAGAVREGLESGDVDIVIGTHALLGKQIAFADLGLLVIDEEQHFGVTHKERLKRLRTDVHVLTLTATPIPRTLQLALTGVREMSVIATPPVDRLAVRTYILPYDPVVLREAILREHYRGGQTFYVCPRVADIDGVAKRIHALVPEVRVATAHGQMPARRLEDVMAGFYERSHDVLVVSTIIESGLDIPTVNTMIVHRADMFGLAQLYQLRGRIGRSKTRAYAYLTLQPDRALSEAAEKRLEVLHRLDSLGAGFSLASHDLDIRGAGNLLGEEQSGQIREVGIELYQHMLEEAVSEVRGAGEDAALPSVAAWAPEINIGTAVLIPETYVTDLGVRLNLYRRVARLEDRAEIDAFGAELVDRFGPLPLEVEHLLEIVSIKQLCRQTGIAKVEAGPKGAVLAFRDDRFAEPERLIDFIADPANDVKLRPDFRLVVARDWGAETERFEGVSALLKTLADIAKPAQQGDTPAGD
jgi:transcription-repair coupling factor (superfamily II helicase)